jgi:GNAT superfamily N-acetyltransferase
MRTGVARTPHCADGRGDRGTSSRADAPAISFGLHRKRGLRAGRRRVPILRNLHYGKFLYVDDLVTRADQRLNGFAGRLLDWLWEQARDQGCSALVLDSGVQRFEAHRFYLQHRMNIVAHHFVRMLDSAALQ